MNKPLHLILKDPDENQQFYPEARFLDMKKAGNFRVTIKEYEELCKQKPPRPLRELTDTQYQNLSAEEKKKYNREIETYNQHYSSYKQTKERWEKKLSSLQWSWVLTNQFAPPQKREHNPSLNRGIQDIISKGYRELSFPKCLEGDAIAWLEIFSEDFPAADSYSETGGLLVKATGTPKIITAEWKDKEGNPITEKVAYGSTVYLHIYTGGLYNREIQVQLKDTYHINADLVPTPADENGDPVQRIDSHPVKTLTRKIETVAYDSGKKPQSTPPAEAVTGRMTENDKWQEAHRSIPTVQKSVIPIYIEPAWKWQAAGKNGPFFWDSGENLEIHPTVTHPFSTEETVLDDCVLKVSEKNGTLYPGELKGNSPVLTGEPEYGGANPDTFIDFTFGVFLDGTLNNLYNSEARQAYEERTGKIATSQKQVKKDKEKKYRYENDSSYENDLSNPAILYQNYVDDETSDPSHKRFRIYTEGIGTTTHPNKEGLLTEESYKNDDTIAAGLGTTAGYQNNGIRAKVRKAITQLAETIISKKDKKEHIKTLTIDVFGFSRGAAAARNFVHEITYRAYTARENYGNYYDRNGYPVTTKDGSLPAHGHLGYLLGLEGIIIERIIVRFAGLYDTVAHHGLVQYNDVKELGLNDIDKAQYVVHLTAEDEHRYNFDLTSISTVTKVSPDSGKKGGIELALPGVHCDVGGSYVEGRPERKERIDAFFDYELLTKLKQELVEQGWFTNEQLTIKYLHQEITDTNAHKAPGKLRLTSYRSYLSNQYSFIPLYMMADFCLKKEVPIDKTELLKKYSFKQNAIPGTIDFLSEIQKILYGYAFEGKEKSIPQDRLKFLRNHFLHWNSEYGQEGMDIISQKNQPNIINGKRQRTIL